MLKTQNRKKKKHVKKNKTWPQKLVSTFMKPFSFTVVQSMNQQLTENEAESCGIMLLILCSNELFNFYFSIPEYQFSLFK